MIPDPSPPFEFEPSGAIRERILRLISRGQELGVGQETVNALAEIIRALTMRPRKWGDPIRHLRKAQATQYRGIHWDIACIYAVHDRVPIVFLTDITPLEENPLFGT